MSSNLADLPIDLLADLSPPPCYWHLVVKMTANLADLPPWYWHLVVKMSSNLADLSPCYWHLVFKMSSNLADLSPWYWHLVVKMSANLADLSLLLLTSSVQDECKFGRSTPRSASRSYPPKNNNNCYASWDIYYGMYLAAILDSSRKGGNFFLFLNN